MSDYIKKAARKYREVTEGNPETKTVLDVLPGTGVLTSAADAAASAAEGKYKEAAVDLIGVIPGLKQVGFLHKMSKAERNTRGVKAGARAVDAAGDVSDYHDAKGYASGGLVGNSCWMSKDFKK